VPSAQRALPEAKVPSAERTLPDEKCWTTSGLQRRERRGFKSSRGEPSSQSAMLSRRRSDPATLQNAHSTDVLSRRTESLLTLRWRGVDSNFRFRDALSSPTARHWSRRLIRR
jgi:hypothetical protein